MKGRKWRAMHARRMFPKPMKTEIPAEAIEQMKREGWATMEEQAEYWERENLARTEATCDWYDHGLCDMETNAERNL